MTDENYREIGLDLASARQRFLGNRELFEKFLFRFPEDQNFVKIMEAVEAGQMEDAFNAAHTLKGVCGNLSLSKLYEKVSEITERLRAEQMPEDEELQALEEVYQETLELVASIKEKGIPEF